MKWFTLSWLVVCLALLYALVGGCTCLPCPSQDMYYLIQSGDGVPIPIFINKGYLDDREVWKSPEEFDEYLSQIKRYQQQLREQEFDKRFGTEE